MLKRATGMTNANSQSRCMAQAKTPPPPLISAIDIEFVVTDKKNLETIFCKFHIVVWWGCGLTHLPALSSTEVLPLALCSGSSSCWLVSRSFIKKASILLLNDTCSSISEWVHFSRNCVKGILGKENDF